jgi:hypothetical protein
MDGAAAAAALHQSAHDDPVTIHTCSFDKGTRELKTP